jgi:hypothetical protein
MNASPKNAFGHNQQSEHCFLFFDIIKRPIMLCNMAKYKTTGV